ncbi:MAG: ABC transporter ATP-binding protein [Bacteroidia bacterium]|nr:ABC transporter ATP-binding protein [Bacteroidia bacterium]
MQPGLTYLAGVNGSGKTTLLKCIAGLRPFEGEIEAGGISQAAASPAAWARVVALAPQQALPPAHLTLSEFVCMGRFPWLKPWGAYSPQDLEAARRWMSRMGLSALPGRRTDELSGGEFQRAVLARTLCREAPVLLLDEPAQSLDPPARHGIYLLLQTLASQGLTVLCATHDPEALRMPGARVVGLREGRVVLDTAAGGLLSRLWPDVYGVSGEAALPIG